MAGEEAVAGGDAEVAAEGVVNAEDELAVGIFVADSSAQTLGIAWVAEGDGVGRFAVASGTPGLLEVLLERAGDVDVHHQPDVGLIDAHAKGIRGHHDAQLAVHPGALPFRLLLAAESGVKEGGRDAFSMQRRGDLGGALAAADVDDGRSACALEDANELAQLVVAVADKVGEVGSGEALAEDVGGTETELLLHVVDGLRGSRGGEGQHGDVGRERLADVSNAEVGGPEIVAPLRDAVTLVDGQQADVHGAELRQEALRGEAFGREVEELVVAEDAVVELRVDLGRGHAHVDSRGLDATSAQVVHLVFHQGDEWRDDEAQPVHGQSRDLESERLAASGRHERERVTSGPDGADDVFLQRSEGIVAPVLLEDFVIAIHPV